MTELLYVCEDCEIANRDGDGCPSCGRVMVPADTVDAMLYPED
jgi:methionyl-tRNA synthetase